MKRARKEEADNNSKLVDRLLQEDYETSRSFCMQQIASINSKEACVYLLQNWLLSLVFCDVSFFVSMQVLPSAEVVRTATASSLEEIESCQYCYTTDTSTVIHRRQQDDGYPGIVYLQLHEPRQSSSESSGKGEIIQKIAIQYLVKVIDCDRKPSKKVEIRHTKEKVFQYLHTVEKKFQGAF